MDLKKIRIPKGMLVNKTSINDIPDHKLCVIIAGSQGQEGSSLVRAVYGEHRIIRINPKDKVIFSADVIPGNEIPFYAAIDELASNKIDVVYPDIRPGLHQSGLVQERFVRRCRSRGSLSLNEGPAQPA